MILWLISVPANKCDSEFKNDQQANNSLCYTALK